MCTVENCLGKPVADGLCDKHYRRLKRHGHLEQTRPADWGSKTKHPLWHSHGAMRKSKTACQEWLNDFWKFVEDVGPKPEKHILRRKDQSKPFSKENFMWSEIKQPMAGYADRNAYMRDYMKRNPGKQKDLDLKKNFGITLEQYVEMQVIQGGVCAICGNPEVDVDKKVGRARMLAVDHNHTTGQIRGLLCRGCNQGIGNFQEDIQRLEKAVQYLKSFIPKDVTSNNP